MQKLSSHTKVYAMATSKVGHVNSGESAHLIVSKFARVTQNAKPTWLACMEQAIIGKELAKFTMTFCQVVAMAINSGPAITEWIYL